VKHKLKVSVNRVLRIIFGTERDEVPGEWRSLMICSPDQIIWVIKSRRLRWAGHVACMGERSGVYRVLVGKPEGKRPFGKSRCRLDDNIKLDLQGVEWGCMDWIDLVQDRDRWRELLNVVMNLQVP